MRHLRLVLPVAIFALMMSAAPGFAAIRYASSAGTVGAPSACAVITGPAACTLVNAVEGASANDTVIVQADGTHTLTTTIDVNVSGLQIVGGYGSSRPIVDSTASQITALWIGGNNTRVTGLKFIGDSDYGGVADIYVRTDGAAGTVLDGLEIRNAGTSFVLWMAGDTVLRNSVVYAAASYTTVFAGGAIRNSTIISDGPVGSSAVSLTDSYPASASLVVRNTLIRSTHGTALMANNSTPGAPDVTHIDIDYSNYDPLSIEAYGGGTVAPGPHNQFEPPLLVTLAAAADVHQLLGSPTINAGLADPANGPLDFDGEPRCLGSAPDIGADEFAGAGCPVATPPVVDATKPALSSLKAVKKKGKLKSFTFNSSEAGKATFKYQRKKGKKYKAAGWQTKTVKAGKNTVKPKKLKKGSYKLTLTVRDAAGNVSTTKKLSFKIK